jgi:hypothetical protein
VPAINGDRGYEQRSTELDRVGCWYGSVQSAETLRQKITYICVEHLVGSQLLQLLLLQSLCQLLRGPFHQRGLLRLLRQWGADCPACDASERLHSQARSLRGLGVFLPGFVVAQQLNERQGLSVERLHRVRNNIVCSARRITTQLTAFEKS